MRLCPWPVSRQENCKPWMREGGPDDAGEGMGRLGRLPLRAPERPAMIVSQGAVRPEPGGSPRITRPVSGDHLCTGSPGALFTSQGLTFAATDPNITCSPSQVRGKEQSRVPAICLFLVKNPGPQNPPASSAGTPSGSIGWNGVQCPPARARPSQEEREDRDKWPRQPAFPGTASA